MPLGFEAWNSPKTLQVRSNVNQAAIAALFRVMNRYVGNLPSMPGVFPDYPAPVVRNAGTGRELTMMRWGMPPPPRTGGCRSLKAKTGSHPPPPDRAVP